MQKVLFLIVCFFTAALSALYDDAGCPVKSLSPDNYKSFLDNTSYPVIMLEFYAPWCGHCKDLSPDYKKAAQALSGWIPMAAINCDQYKELCSSLGIRGYPTLKVVTIDNVKDKKMTKKWSDYNGGRDYAEIVDGLKGLYPNMINTKFGMADLEKMTKNSSDTMPKVILFTDKNWDNGFFKRMAYEYRRKLAMIHVQNRNDALAMRFKIQSFPSLIVLTKSRVDAGHESLDTHVYKGKNEYAAIKEFLDSFLGLENAIQVPQLDSKAHFDKYCLQAPGICVIALVSVPTSREDVQKLKLLDTLHLTPPIGGGNPLFSYSWINRSKHADALANFDPRSEQHKTGPNLLILNAKRQKYGVWMGQWTRQNIDSVLADVKLGDFKMEAYAFHPFYENINKAEL